MNLSDALRGAADRAPVEDAAVDVPLAARRAARHRGLRTGANGLMGAGAVALVAVAMVGPGSALDTEDSTAGRDTAAVAEADGAYDSAGGDAGLAAGSSLAWGLCGTSLPDLSGMPAPGTLEATIGGGDFEGGAQVGVSTTLVPSIDGTVETFGVDAVVLWDGIVVGTRASGLGDDAAGGLTTEDLVAGEPLTRELTVPLVNCWDGEPLPPAKYELVASEELWPVAVAEPAPEPAPSEAVEPDAGTSDGAGSDSATSDGAGSDSATSDGAADAAVTGPAASAGGRVVAPPVGFAVAGDPVEDPFAAYLGVAVDPVPVEPSPDGPAVPDGALDPETLRSLYRDGLAGPWDMAAGTQRWLATSDSARPNEYQWFGCGDGQAFPAESAVLDLLDVQVDAPASIDVSYGWVVEGNPGVSARLTNTSEWDLATFWGKSSMQLTLVRDGAVVAEGYPVDPYQNMRVMSEAEAASSSLSIAPYTDGLAAGESWAQDYLWRDVNACWTGAAPAEIEPGTYTLLVSHYLSVGGGWGWAEGAVEDLGTLESEKEALLREQEAAASDGAGVLGGGTSGSSGSVLDDAADQDAAIGMVPAPDGSWDAVELQVWTSLGQITVR